MPPLNNPGVRSFDHPHRNPFSPLAWRLFLLYAAGLAQPRPPPPPPPPMTNIAIGRTIFASSLLSNEYPPTYANDGIIPPNGGNSSTFISTRTPGGQWLTIDFVRNNSTNSTPSVNLAVAELQVMYGAGYGIDSAALSTSIQPDEAACCQACYTSAPCLYWDYVRSTGTCRLKGDQGPTLPPGQSIPGFYRDTDRMAGAKRGVSTFNLTTVWQDPRAISIFSDPEALNTARNRTGKQSWFIHFHKTFTTPVPITGATFRLGANRYSGLLFVNGIEPSPSIGTGDKIYSSVNLTAGLNMLVIRIFNLQGFTWASGLLFAPNKTLLLVPPTTATITPITKVAGAAIPQFTLAAAAISSPTTSIARKPSSPPDLSRGQGASFAPNTDSTSEDLSTSIHSVVQRESAAEPPTLLVSSAEERSSSGSGSKSKMTSVKVGISAGVTAAAVVIAAVVGVYLWTRQCYQKRRLLQGGLSLSLSSARLFYAAAKVAPEPTPYARSPPVPSVCDCRTEEEKGGDDPS
ncbi:hypothetical protein VOLCADRAFT_92913 [Volvox carteri f. nagariensis]|uniref:Apple domain-containing protein n=1 Tax=Volvox carteri f. nagariensis TaxID=3068 RepID=D8U0T0_VOLCA|nr:uncharacterized protein VOLCADRAFT_92913 [Volvox carteri f. nagariensis]EFJ46768.1 hypothetical protein VOLCADRAFT_92913 [Volvox carteri f. nagariensis]|eukprot:XP_002952297.1 hypothetical protein VOLCADRAFT_92913 [Volvox carteri f. nagariensis]